MTEPQPAAVAGTGASAKPPPFGRFALLWFSYFVAIGSFNPYAPLWFKDLGFSALAIGAISSLQAWSRVLTPYGWGWLGDHRPSRVKLIRLAALGTVFFACGLLWVRGYAAVATVVFLLYTANGGIVPLSEAALARHLNTDDGMDSERYGRVRMWGSVGFISAVVLIGGALQGMGIGWFPVLVVGACALLAWAAHRLPVEERALAPSHAAGSAPPVLHVLRQPAVAWFFASIFFTVLAHTSLYAFFSLYLDSLSYGKASIGLIWAVGVVAEIAFFRFQGRWFERCSPAQWLQVSSGVSVLRFALIAAAGHWWPVLVFVSLLHAITFAAQHVAIIVFVNERFAGPLRGRGQALYTVIGYGASGVIGGVAGGSLIEQLGLASVFWAAAASAAVGWFCAWRATALQRPEATSRTTPP